jgi:hypothetical protein
MASTLPTFAVALKGKAQFLATTLDVSAELLRELRNKGIITAEHNSQIQQVADKSGKVDKLIEILERRPDEDFPEFCKILVERYQEHVVDEIWPQRPILGQTGE